MFRKLLTILNIICFQELGYSDGIVDVRAFRSAKLLGNTGSGAVDSTELE